MVKINRKDFILLLASYAAGIFLDTVGLAILKTPGTVDKIQDNSVWSQPQIARAIELELGARSTRDIKVSSENVKDIDYIIANLA